MDQRELAETLVEHLRPHLTEEDMYYVEGAQVIEDWPLLITMMRSFAHCQGLELPESPAT